MAKRSKKSDSVPLLDRENFLPIYFNNLSTRYSRSASQVFLRLFHVGIIEWRIVSILSNEQNITANRIADMLSTHKAAISRSLSDLEKGGYVLLTPSSEDSRKRLITLTPKGTELHGKIVPLALERERLLLQGFSTDEKALLIGLLRRLNDSLPSVEAYDRTL